MIKRFESLQELNNCYFELYKSFDYHSKFLSKSIRKFMDKTLMHSYRQDYKLLSFNDKTKFTNHLYELKQIKNKLILIRKSKVTKKNRVLQDSAQISDSE